MRYLMLCAGLLSLVNLAFAETNPPENRMTSECMVYGRVETVPFSILMRVDSDNPQKHYDFFNNNLPVDYDLFYELSVVLSEGKEDINLSLSKTMNDGVEREIVGINGITTGQGTIFFQNGQSYLTFACLQK